MEEPYRPRIEDVIDWVIKTQVAPRADPDLNLADLKARALGRAPEIEARTLEQRQQLAQAQQLLRARKRAAEAVVMEGAAVGRARLRTIVTDRRIRVGLLLSLGAGAILLALLGVVSSATDLLQRLPERPGSLLATLAPAVWLASILAVAAIFLLRTGWSLRHPPPATDAVAVEDAEAAVAAAETALARARDDVVAETVTGLANAMRPSWDLELRWDSRNQLAEIYNPELAIETEAELDLRARLALMPGGSVGLAGTRGAGKTTLMRLYCDRPASPEPAPGVIRVMVSAPVRYDTVDFTLHLFAKLCRVVQGDRSFDAAQRLDGRLPPRSPWVPPVHPMALLYAGMLAMLLGFGLFGMGMALVLEGYRTALIEAAEAQAHAIGNAETIGAAAGNGGGNSRREGAEITTGGITGTAEVDGGGNDGKAAGSTDGADDVAEVTAQPATDAATTGEAPADATAEAEAGAAGAVPAQSNVVTIMANVLGLSALQCLIAGSLFVFGGYFLYGYGMRVRRSLSWRDHDERTPYRSDSRHLARDWAEQLAFQQSYRSGYSGALELPVGVKASLSGEESLARRPLSLPEIIDGYRRLVGAIVADVGPKKRGDSPGSVMIGIDELDKIDDIDRAQAFLNDIKALFGIEGCFYLISVSDNAMSNFELRGLPFRDAFDSALDDILRVGPLTLDGSIKLIERRVFQLSRPFLMLCHCLSGGLPRDVIRVCRRLLKESTASEAEVETLSAATARLVAGDVVGRLAGAKVAALQRGGAADARLVVLLGQFEAASDAAAGDVAALIALLLGAAETLGRVAAQQAAADAADDQGEDAAGARRAMAELAAYFAFAATVLALFGLAKNGAELRAAAVPGGVAERLARARQAFADGTETALARINAVRAAIPGLDPVPSPGNQVWPSAEGDDVADLSSEGAPEATEGPLDAARTSTIDRARRPKPAT